MWSKSILFMFVAPALLLACASQPQPAPISPLPQRLVLYDWAGYMPQSILDAFAEETGIQVEYAVYADQDEAMAHLRAGDAYDIVVLDNTNVPLAVGEGLLAQLDYENIPNFRYVSSGFRDLAYDPGNTYSIMIQWGTTGLVVRTDRIEEPITSWADLWDPRYAGKIGIWPYPVDMFGITLKSLGYSLNSQDPEELAKAADKLLALRPNVFLIDPTLATGVAHLMDDQTAMIYGWSYDAREAALQLDTTTYVIPREGTILWSDNVTIPVNSPHKAEAEQFINFLLRPDISATMVNELWVASPNEAAWPLIQSDILNNPTVYPVNEDLTQGEFYEGTSAETERFYQQTWKRFLAAGE